ncbi:MAG: DUF5666 domain-containing protein [Candidatus Uhrbacteria bacterium]|nr:DUF5666 domain-containing protein [Candidatus Uhrbacteria bacterium]
MNKTQVFRTAVGIAATASMLMTGTAFAAPKDMKVPGRPVMHVQTKGVSEDHLVGKIAAVNGSGFTVTRLAMKKDAPTTASSVHTTDSTKFMKDGKAATLADVATGQMVVVSGTIDKATSVMAATSVKITSGKPMSDVILKKDTLKNPVLKTKMKPGVMKAKGDDVKGKGVNKEKTAPVQK